MPLHVALTHRTTYRYSRPVALGPQTIRLRPAPHARTPVLSYALTISPTPHFVNWQQDPQGNYQARVVFPDRVTHFDVGVDLTADMATINPFDFFLEPEAERWPFSYDPVLEQELAPFCHLAPAGPLLDEFLAAVPRGGQPTVDMLTALNRRVHDRIAYIVRLEPGVWAPERSLEEGRGSCRDSAWLLVQALRRLGYAARFVSGYLIQLVPDVKPLEGPQGPTSDFTDLHAWAEAYLPGAGWVGLDPTSGLLTGEGHIPLAATPDPGSAAPISGLVEPCDVEFAFDLKVTRVWETPRVTKPYTDQQWQDILAKGAEVDRALVAGDMRLTMGGEPTFISATDMDAPEWNTDALGPTKRLLAGRLLRRLAALWSPGAALQHGFGKHYPGEQLPRWALFSHWRLDGEPIWRDATLLASDDDANGAAAGGADGAGDAANTGAGGAAAADAARFCAILAGRLHVDPALIQPAYEDVHYFLWREHRLPANVLTDDAKLRDPLERDRLARVFGQGLGAPVGSVLPLRCVHRLGTRTWQSAKWPFRSDVLLLIPGDSPIGYRLPLDSLPHAEPETIEYETEPDPFAPRAPLPSYESLRGSRAGASAPTDAAHTASRAEPGLVRTALAVEARGGLIHVFIPPLYVAEDWLDLVGAIEDTAAETGRKVVLEGYVPPRDPRMLHFSVTPDPGVIEVNVHPAANWAEIVSRGDQLYEEARQVGLGTEKFMLDGRHVGTGGGNHVVMGAARPEDSPFLRRPDLLKSLLGFWHNHPSLSYLFSGLFIGPSSQHPRIDEARQDALAELEIAFAHVQPGVEVPPWLTDRLFRNLLADMTGNTHRTEFCIDKLYAPETSSGRLGLVEYRALEMPPHARMAAAQLLLIRAMLAAFWHQPYERELIRWGTRIHDDFMLPYFVQQDFADVMTEMRQAGMALSAEWFRPHFEFRFPKYGDFALLGTELELRQALEPWHVMGEEVAVGGTARYVDSSVERLQVHLTGLAPDRYALTCNGRRVPLRPTGNAGEYVAGVRYRAWQPPSALHPRIGVHSPLTFDLIDTWLERSLGGCQYHVVHPGGRSYATFPVNSFEAESRRLGRFFRIGHTPGIIQAPPASTNPEFPFTLDLRRRD